ncbi:YidC/Oxa1 family membrane protein insertase [Eubacterium sp. AB3007]|uniref:YidC/Oxa1 family membrane protein insertase n=1 Tax=Eubacterium sp. AB3007 TaxID=1392487 RepID=UPI00068E59AD|nr:YidC/Oxa1 family membrane protein insertase [Eubacterium sp. AB3007]
MNIFGILAMPLSYALQGLYEILGNYGISLIILTVIIKLLLYPLYKKQIMSTMGMSEMAPKMQAIQRQYANDKEKMNEKISELYKEEGVNPMAGCLPMFIQMIIIMGLFQLLRYPLQYLSSEDMVFAVHESFLWINDLAQPDPWILPILAGIATFISFWMSSNNGSMPGGSQSNAMMLVMRYGFPIMIVWLAKTYPAGLAWYWFISQFIQIFYNIRFNQLRKKAREKSEEKMKKKKHKKKAVRA